MQSAYNCQNKRSPFRLIKTGRVKSKYVSFIHKKRQLKNRKMFGRAYSPRVTLHTWHFKFWNQTLQGTVSDI